MKKVLTLALFFILTTVISIALTACGASDESKYNEGVEAMNNGDWDAAIEAFTDLDYEDSATLLDECIKEKGMHENADYEYLETLAEDIQLRYSKTKDGSTDESLVNTELTMLEPFKDREFYDKDLKALSDKYLEGVYKQKEALSLEYSECQIAWQEGLVIRSDVLKELTDSYGFLEDDVDYKANYYNDVEKAHEDLDKLKAIEEDLVNQLDGAEAELISDSTGRLHYTNKTEYNFNLIMHFTFYDENEVHLESIEEYYENIKVGKKVNLDFYCPAETSTWECSWEIELRE